MFFCLFVCFCFVLFCFVFCCCCCCCFFLFVCFLLVYGFSLYIGFSFGAEGMEFAALPDYFDRYFAISQSIGHLGMSVGVMTLPLLTQFLRFIYGWRGSILILGGFNAHITVCGALLRPTIQSTSKPMKCNTTERWNKKENIRVNLKNHLSNENESLIEKLSRWFDLHLFTNFDFVSVMLITIATGYYYTGWLIYLVPHAEDLGFLPYTATALATIGGVGNIIGSCVFPLVATKISTKSLLYISNLLVFLSLVIDPVLSLKRTYAGLVVASFIMNVGEAMGACALLQELYKVVDLASFTSASNYLWVSYSFGSLCSGFLSGRQKYGKVSLN